MNKDEQSFAAGVLVIVMFVVAFIFACMGVYPYYHVYAQRMDGQAQLAHATASKEVAVAEAKAKMESAEFLSKAEIIRAEGVAKANTIIGDSLKDNESYLRYLWIQNLERTGNQQVIYIPTEAGLPILESTRHLQLPTAEKR
jgi:regulator of protease activity HflC (stomatin/prohibitin superfamily)